MCTICQTFRAFDPDCAFRPIEAGTLAIAAPALANVFENADAPASVGTGYAISVGDTFFGSLSGDTDWIAVSVKEGETYAISLNKA